MFNTKCFIIILLATTVLTACGNSDQLRRRVTTADYGLKGDILEVVIKRVPVLSPQLFDLDSASISVQTTSSSCFKDNILQYYRVVDSRDSSLGNTIYTYNMDKGGRYRLGYNTKPDGTTDFETFLISDDGITSVEKGVNPDSSLNYKNTIKWNKQQHTRERLTELSDGWMLLIQDSCNEQGNILKQKLTISPLFSERIANTNTFTYLNYDEQGNWTKRLETKMTKRDTSYILETQTITYKK